MRIDTIKNTILSALSLLLLTSCQWFVQKESVVERSLLMYWSVSNLSGYMSVNLDDIRKSPFVPEYFEKGESGDVLLMLSDMQSDSIPSLKRIYRDEFGQVQEEILAEYPGRTTVDPVFMGEVLSYAQKIFPAKESGLMFSSHGSGWIPEGYYSKPNSSRSVCSQMSEEYDPYAHLVKSFGEVDKKEMDIMDLASNLPMKYSYVIFDACLMGNIEVAYELKDKADYMVLSPAEIMGAGFPYGDVLEQVFYVDGGVENRMVEVARSFYELYKNYPDTSPYVNEQSGTIAVIKSSKLPQVGACVKSILENDSDRVEALDVKDVQRYFRLSSRHWFYDLTDFMSHISTDENRMSAFQVAMNEAVIAKYATDAFLDLKIDEYSGLGAYIPKPADPFLDSYYKNLAWNKTVGLIK